MKIRRLRLELERTETVRLRRRLRTTRWLDGSPSSGPPVAEPLESDPPGTQQGEEVKHENEE